MRTGLARAIGPGLVNRGLLPDIPFLESGWPVSAQVYQATFAEVFDQVFGRQPQDSRDAGEVACSRSLEVSAVAVSVCGGVEEGEQLTVRRKAQPKDGTRLPVHHGAQPTDSHRRHPEPPVVGW